MTKSMYESLLSVIADMEEQGIVSNNQVERYNELCDIRNEYEAEVSNDLY